MNNSKKFTDIIKNKKEESDQKYIKKDNTNIKDNLSQSAIEQIEEIKDKLLKTRRKQERELDKEIGGLEVDYEKVSEKTNEDIDVWDDLQKKKMEKEEELEDTITADSSHNESFIHNKKRGKKRKRLGEMLLGDKDDRKMSFREKLQNYRQLKKDHGEGREM